MENIRLNVTEEELVLIQVALKIYIGSDEKMKECNELADRLSKDRAKQYWEDRATATKV